MKECVHPYKSTDTWWYYTNSSEYEQLFSWCKLCKKIVNWHDTNMQCRTIPAWWPEKAKKLAAKLSGFKIERDKHTMIDITIGEPGLGLLLKKLYAKQFASQTYNTTNTNNWSVSADDKKKLYSFSFGQSKYRSTK